jgi:hypothetical protein
MDVIVAIFRYCSVFVPRADAYVLPTCVIAAWVGHSQIRWRSGYELMGFCGDLIPIKSGRN